MANPGSLTKRIAIKLGLAKREPVVSEIDVLEREIRSLEIQAHSRRQIDANRFASLIARRNQLIGL